MKEKLYRWEWLLRSSPEQLWPLVSDTDRFNRDVGLSSVRAGPPEDGKRRVRLGKLLEWEEEPFEWERPKRFAVRRRFLRGPLDDISVAVDLEPVPGTVPGTRLVYEIRVRPRNVVGAAAIPLQIGVLSRRRFERTLRRYDELARGGNATRATAEPRLAPGGRERLGERLGKLPFELAARLGDTLATADDGVLGHLRPYALADEWGADRRAVLELCLHATRAGILDLLWDVLCPFCRGAQASPSTLRDLDPNVHCESCGIDFRAELDRSVEATFRPSPAIREVADAEFCVGGPGLTPHVVVQQRLEPRETRELRPALEPGRYRIRGGEELEVQPGERPAIRLENPTDEATTVVLERTAWSDQAATAAEVTALQAFRDLFAAEALRPGEPLSVGSLAVVFTDLRDSTRYYRDVGDAPAFAAVRTHLEVLHDVVGTEGGAVVKTMGDAVMAVFSRPALALRALERAHEELAGRPLVLKSGVHFGPCIAVTQNDRLDYFGSTVNAAARLPPLSAGDDVVLTEAVRADPEVAELLADRPLDALDAELKGFDERFRLYRVSCRR